MKKRILSTFLVAVLLLALCPVLDMNAQAAAVSDVTAFRDKWIRKHISGEYGNECVALFDEYISSVFGVNWRDYRVGSAYELYTRYDYKSLGWSKLSYSAKTVRVGDIVVWNHWKKADGYKQDNPHGHVGVITVVSGNTVKVFEQSLDKNANEYDIYYTGAILGVIRPKFDGNPSLKYYLDLNGYFDGKLYGNFSDWGTCDLTVNDKKVGDDVSDHYTKYAAGSTYSISNIKAKPGYSFGGFQTGKISGTIYDTTKVTLLFFADKREFHPAPGQYMLYSSVAANRTAAIKDGSTASQANVQLATASTGSTAQIFTISAKDAWYMMKNQKSGLYLDVAKYNRNDGANVWQFADNGGGQQHWRFLDAGDGMVLIQSRLGQFLEVADGASAAGTNIQASHLKENKAQKWKLVRVDGKCADGHTWDAGKQSVPACEVGGTRTYTCTVCGSTMTEYVAGTGHKYTTTVTPPTCTKQGYTTRTCSACGEMFFDSFTPATGHSWGEWTVVKQPTETAAGARERVCANCGEKQREEIAKLDPTSPSPKPEDPTPVTPKPADNPFVDVKNGDYFFEPVLWALKHDPQITDGMTETTFVPDGTCTRGQVVTFLWRAMGCAEPKTTQNPFQDVRPSDYFYKAVLWAIEKDITDGTSDTTFSPEDPCTRAHVVTFLWRSEGKPDAGKTNPFADVPAGEYYFNPVLWAVSKQITDGTSDTTFSPDDPCTRGQIVTFLYRDMK